MRFLKHFGKLIGEFSGFAKEHKAYWIIPIVIILIVITFIIVASSTLAPFIYTLF
jgi:hypothetical protein